MSNVVLALLLPRLLLILIYVYTHTYIYIYIFTKTNEKQKSSLNFYFAFALCVSLLLQLFRQSKVCLLTCYVTDLIVITIIMAIGYCNSKHMRAINIISSH